jgi:hypothetical protein
MALMRERPATRGGVDRAEKISSSTNVFSSTPTVAVLQVAMLARRFGLTLPTARLVASIAFGEARI